jgi:hypothetical protein
MWHLFVDSWKLSLKAVFLHIVNVYSYLHVTHPAHMTECYKNMQQVFKCIAYYKCLWNISDDLEIIALVLVMLLAYTKCGVSGTVKL